MEGLTLIYLVFYLSPLCAACAALVAGVMSAIRKIKEQRDAQRELIPQSEEEVENLTAV
jgi:hypothetical protein